MTPELSHAPALSHSHSPTATFARFWAVARLTFKEAVRRKVFLIVVIFAVALIASAPFLPAMSPESRLRLIEVWSIRASFLFSLILAVFLAGFSITGDVEQRRIYTLVTKPIHKVNLFLGKFAGFVLMIAAFLGCTGVITLGYLRSVAALTPGFPELRAQPRFEAAELEAVNGAEVSREIGSVRVVGGRPGALVWTFEGLDPAGFDPDVDARLKVDLGRLGQEYALEGMVRLEVRAPGGSSPHELLLDLRTNQVVEWTFSRSCIGADGRLEIELTTPSEGLVVIAKTGEAPYRSAVSPRSLVLYGRSELFELTYFKGLLLILFQATVVLGITLAASTVLSAPVSIMAGIVLFLIGWSWSFLAESVRDIDHEVKSFREAEPGHRHGPEPVAPPWMMEVSAAVSKVVLRLVPNYDLFNMSDYLLKDLAVMRRDLGNGFLAMAPRVAFLLLIGLIAMWRRDFAT